jgi:hypothetical protein
MKARKLAVVIVIVGSMVFLLGEAFSAWAGGAGGVNACCVVKNKDGALKLEGTASVVYSPPLGSTSPSYVDVILRLERENPDGTDTIGYYPLHLDRNIYGLDNWEFACLILNPNEPDAPPSYPGAPPSGPAVAAIVDEILSTFYPGAGLDHTNTKLVITRKSITETDGNAGEPVPGTARYIAIGDVKVFVAGPGTTLKYENNPNCPVLR